MMNNYNICQESMGVKFAYCALTVKSLEKLSQSNFSLVLLKILKVSTLFSQ